MDYEKAYKEAIERADTLTEKYGGRDFAEYVFPELAESEDEKIRKAIIAFIKDRLSDYGDDEPEYLKKWFAWLEKQKEQKAAEWSEEDVDLEEAAMNYIAPIENEDGLKVINFSGRDMKDAFKAGAEWQKGQMMKVSMEGEVCVVPGYVAYVKEKNNESLKQYLLDNFNAGDKVRIIIVKEDKQ